MRKLWILALVPFLVGPSCDNTKLCEPLGKYKCDCYVVEHSNLVYVPCKPEESPSPSPTIEPSPEPTPTIEPSPIPTPSPSISPSPSVPPSPSPTIPPQFPQDCSLFKSFRTGWGILIPKDAGCDGNNCTFVAQLNKKYSIDSTSRYNGNIENWKTCDCVKPSCGIDEKENDLCDNPPCDEWPVCHDGGVGVSEYPPPNRYGFQCPSPTVWTVPACAKFRADNIWQGELVFVKTGNCTVCAARKDNPNMKTCKTAIVR